jgi:hypothetical protein
VPSRISSARREAPARAAFGSCGNAAKNENSRRPATALQKKKARQGEMFT